MKSLKVLLKEKFETKLIASVVSCSELGVTVFRVAFEDRPNPSSPRAALLRLATATASQRLSRISITLFRLNSQYTLFTRFVLRPGIYSD